MENSPNLPTTETAPPDGLRPPPRRWEWLAVLILGAMLFLPGLGTYSLVDPWETHYAEVARRMVQDHDYVRTQWSDEGFRSKPVLSFWLMSASMRALGIGGAHAYEGEMAISDAPTRAVRLPFALCGLLGLIALWYSLRRTVGTAVAWVAFGVVATSPFYLLVARQAITDITMVASLVGAMAMFALANEAGETPLRSVAIGRWQVGPLHFAVALFLTFVAWQAVLIASYPGQHATALAQVVVGRWRVPIRAVLYGVVAATLLGCAWLVAWRPRWRRRLAWLPLPKPVTTLRQLAMLGFFALLGVSILGKGLPAFGIAGVVAALVVLSYGRWQALRDGAYELRRGFIILLIIAVPWHYAMYAAEGPGFYSEYVGTHLLGRAFNGVFGERGTFLFYIKELGTGLLPWIAFVPLALGMATQLSLRTTRERTIAFYAIWAAVAVAFFSMVETKFHHYILPAVPPLGVLIAWSLCQSWQARRALPAVLMGIGGAWALLIANDLMTDPAQWIELFVFRFDRPWPLAAPWSIDPSDRFFALGLIALGLVVAGALWRRLTRGALVAFGALAIIQAVWAAHGYMRDAGTHWGMRDAMRQYYRQRDVYGADLVYFNAAQLAADWTGTTTWSLATVVPDGVVLGQPMSIRIALRGEGASEWTLPATVERLTSRAIVLRLAPGVATDAAFASWRTALAKGQALAATLVATCHETPKAKDTRCNPPPPVRLVDASRLLGWALYWRGEHFWSSDAIYGPLPSYQTSSGQRTDPAYLTDYLNDPSRAAVGRTYFILSEARWVGSTQAALPSATAKATWRVVNTDSNKFTLSKFTL